MTIHHDITADNLPRCGALTAIVYREGAEGARSLLRIADLLRAAGYRCVGLLQRDEPRPGRSRCDMILEDLATGERTPISEDRGAEARGCHLDPDALIAAMTTVRAGLDDDADVLLLNKFGKSEAEGGGLRPLIADAMDRGMAIVLGVPVRNLDNWRAFAGDFGIEVAVDTLATQSARDIAAALCLPPPQGRRLAAGAAGPRRTPTF